MTVVHYEQIPSVYDCGRDLFFALPSRLRVYLSGMVRIWLLLAIFVVASPQVLNAQTPANCPTITVTGPAGIVTPGEYFYFAAELSGPVPEDVSFSWTINDVEIVDGQGTVKVQAKFLESAVGRSVTGTIKLTGLPEGCPDSAAMTFSIGMPPEPEELGSTGDRTFKIDPALLNRIRLSLEENPTSQLYVVVYYASPERELARIKFTLIKQLSKTKIDPDRFTIAAAGVDFNRATFWRVPPGASNPAP